LDIYNKYYGQGNPHPDIAYCYNKVGMIHKHDNEYDDAQKNFNKALLMYTEYYEQENPNIALCHNNIGHTHFI